MVHTQLLLLGLTLVLLLTQTGLQLAAFLRHPADRQRLRLFILALPPLGLALLSADIIFMAMRGCIHNWTTADAWVTGALISTWATLAALAAARHLYWQRRLRADLALLPAAQADRVGDLAGKLAVQLGLHRRPEVEVYHVDRPLAATVGWRRPRVVLSTWLLERLSDRELEAVVAHELVHVQRRDPLVLAAGGWSRGCAGLFPAVRRSWADLLAEQERAVDAQAAALTRRPAAMASALLKCWEGTETPPGGTATAFAPGDTLDLEDRIANLLRPRPDRPSSPRLRPWVLAALAAGLIALALSPAVLMPSDLLFSCRFMP